MLNPQEVEVEGLSRPGTHKGPVQRRMLAVLLDHEARDELSTSGRFLFYEMEGPGWARKTVATDLIVGATPGLALGRSVSSTP